MSPDRHQKPTNIPTGSHHRVFVLPIRVSEVY